LTDQGPDPATGVVVADPLPPGLSFVAAAPQQGSYDAAGGLWAVGAVVPGVPLTLTLRARVESPAAQTNVAAVSAADQFDPNTANNQASVTETPQQADLALSKAVSDATPNVGATITFTVTLVNHGPGAATGVAVADPLPAGLTFISAVPGQGTYDAATGQWTVGTVAAGTPLTLSIKARVESPAAQTNVAAVSAADQFDPDTANNQASVTETPQQADLALAKSVDDPAPNVGGTVTFTVTLTDHGPDPATGVSVEDLLPAGLTFLSAAPGQGTYSPATGLWTVGAVAVGTPVRLRLQARVDSPAAQVNTAAVAAADQFDPD